MDDDTFNQMMMLRTALESSIASQMILSARLDALRSMVLEVFEELEAVPESGATLAEHLIGIECRICNEHLARVADNDPNLASAMKQEIDRMLGTKI